MYIGKLFYSVCEFHGFLQKRRQIFQGHMSNVHEKYTVFEIYHIILLVGKVPFQQQKVDITVNPVLSGHTKIGKIKISMTNSSLMKVESIAECPLGALCNTLTCINGNWCRKPICGLFDSGRFRQVLMYYVSIKFCVILPRSFSPIRTQEISVLIAYAKMPLISTQTDVSSEATCRNLVTLRLHINPFCPVCEKRMPWRFSDSPNHLLLAYTISTENSCTGSIMFLMRLQYKNVAYLELCFNMFGITIH